MANQRSLGAASVSRCDITTDTVAALSSASWKDGGFEDDFSEDASCISTIRSGMLVPFSGESTPPPATKEKRLRFGPKSTVTSLASPSTIGGSALALHYANICR
ncbi:hypothetical protein ACQ4PT_050958 [Festuca glaucescens]